MNKLEQAFIRGFEKRAGWFGNAKKVNPDLSDAELLDFMRGQLHQEAEQDKSLTPGARRAAHQAINRRLGVGPFKPKHDKAVWSKDAEQTFINGFQKRANEVLGNAAPSIPEVAHALHSTNSDFSRIRDLAHHGSIKSDVSFGGMSNPAGYLGDAGHLAHYGGKAVSGVGAAAGYMGAKGVGSALTGAGEAASRGGHMLGTGAQAVSRYTNPLAAGIGVVRLGQGINDMRKDPVGQMNQSAKGMMERDPIGNFARDVSSSNFRQAGGKLVTNTAGSLAHGFDPRNWPSTVGAVGREVGQAGSAIAGAVQGGPKVNTIAPKNFAAPMTNSNFSIPNMADPVRSTNMTNSLGAASHAAPGVDAKPNTNLGMMAPKPLLRIH